MQREPTISPRCNILSQETSPSTANKQHSRLPSVHEKFTSQCNVVLQASSSKSYGFKTQSHHPICPLSTSKKKKTAVPYPHYCVKRNPKKIITNHSTKQNHTCGKLPLQTEAYRPPTHSYGCIFTNKKISVPIKEPWSIIFLVNFHSTRSIFYPPWLIYYEREGAPSRHDTRHFQHFQPSSRSTSSSKQVISTSAVKKMKEIRVRRIFAAAGPATACYWVETAMLQ
ncbi:hypothetical protein V8C43DRAFT_284962 [Trichoderma afarasin]